MRRLRLRKKRRGLKSVITWVDSADTQVSSYSSHRILDARSLAMHVLIAEKVCKDPHLIDKAKHTLQRWRERRTGEPAPWMSEWARILTRPYLEIAAVMTDMNATSTRLRQSSPFAGILSASERKRIYEAFRT
jgi:hypothetical protein